MQTTLLPTCPTAKGALRCFAWPLLCNGEYYQDSWSVEIPFVSALQANQNWSDTAFWHIHVHMACLCVLNLADHTELLGYHIVHKAFHYFWQPNKVWFHSWCYFKRSIYYILIISLCLFSGFCGFSPWLFPTHSPQLCSIL